MLVATEEYSIPWYEKEAWETDATSPSSPILYQMKILFGARRSSRGLGRDLIAVSWSPWWYCLEKERPYCRGTQKFGGDCSGKLKRSNSRGCSRVWEKKKKGKPTVDLKLQTWKVTNKLKKGRVLPCMEPSVILIVTFKNLLLHQKLRRHQKTNIFYDDKVWMPVTMCGFDGAEHMDSVIGTVSIVFFNTRTYCKTLQDLGISTAASQ